MALALPSRASVALAVTVDFDAHSVWMGSLGLTSPSYLSRGEFGAVDGVRRLLDLFRDLDLRTTWFVPGHTLETFTDQALAVRDAGHEIAAHGCYHEYLPKLEPARERELMIRQLEQHAAVLDLRPRGYRSPAWDFTDLTVSLLEEFGFEWDSSLMGREFQPYRPRPVELHWEQGNRFGEPSSLLEIPVSWYTVDWESFEFVPGVAAGLGATDVVLGRWRDIVTFARDNEPGGAVVITVHPQTSGRSHQLMMLREFLSELRHQDEIWFATMSEIYDAWSE